MLHVHRAERADALADALAGILADPPADPLAAEIVAVPTRGMERWLTQRMSACLGALPGRRDGVCANVEFPFPGRLTGDVLAAVSGVDPDGDPWLPTRLVWPLLAVVDECLDEPWLSLLAGHLNAGAEGAEAGARRFATVRHIAELYDRYGVRRPAMLRAWAGGEDSDGEGAPLAQDSRWQAELWRRLREHLALPSPAERLPEACQRLREQPGLLALPERLSLFGLTRLPAGYLHVLEALAARREVHLFVLHPSPQLWAQLERHETRRLIPRREDRTAELPRNRILRSWGQDARELQLALGTAGERATHHHAVPDPPDTLLGRIQAAVRADRAESAAGAPLDPGDRSLQVHACHGRARQVEVMRDAILHLLAEDPTLEPRDVIVMCPDIETVAPLIQATFGAGRVATETEDLDEGEGHGAGGAGRLPDLRVRLADRSLRQTNPVLGVVAQLLELADQRLTASQLLDLIDREPVRRRFGFDDEDVSRIGEWVASSGIRWGLDARGRARFRLDVVPDGTWRAGLDRILLGVALGDEQRPLVGGALPLDDVESGAIDLAGRLAEFASRLGVAVTELNRRQPLEAWARSLGAAVDALAASAEHESWQRVELGRLLDQILEEATGGAGIELELGDVRSLLAERLRGRPTRANFRTGHLTVCTLVPMRSVPHRIVCILGLDDGEFPRKAARDGDDLLLAEPRIGDRDPRAEDRQLLLDALLAASEKLIITYTGHDERTNLPRPPAVPVAELLDVADRSARVAEGRVRDHVLVHHPLQPFDPRNFLTGRLDGVSRPWSFDRTALGGAQALCAPRRAPRPFLSTALPAPEGRVLELERLVAFVEHPVRAFLSQRLGLTVRESVDEVRDALAVELDPLERWQVGQRLLDGVLSGLSLEHCVAAERVAGTLPPARLADAVLERICPVVGAIAQEAARHGSGPPRALHVELALPDGRVLAGSVPGVRGETVRRVSYSRVRPRDRLAAWVRLLALTAARPEQPARAVVVGRGERRGLGVAVIEPLGEEASARRAAALAELAKLVDLYDRGMREPLPIACQASAAYARTVRAGGDAVAAAADAWETNWEYEREDRDPEHVLVWGGQRSLSDLLDEPPRAEEVGEGWPEHETSRFGIYALRLWDGLLSREGRREG